MRLEAGLHVYEVTATVMVLDNVALDWCRIRLDCLNLFVYTEGHSTDLHIYSVWCNQYGEVLCSTKRL